MASVNSLLTQISSGETMRDYKHASKTFIDNNFELHPKFSHLFHVVFEFTPDAATLFDTTTQLEIPLLVKSADLPAYTMDVQTHNQYNRKTQSHHAFQYQPVTIRFHDDTKEVIRTLWHNYYTFYNADPTYDIKGNAYTTSDRYANRNAQQWGLQRGNKRFFKNIKIYSMQNHKFAEYTLVNPIITAFNHDQHAYANGGLMENTMQVAYETVKYATGFMNNINPRGFGDIHYDVETSDLSATTISENTAFIDGTLRDVTGQDSSDLFKGDVIGTITDADIVFDQTRLTTGNVIQDTIAIFTNNLLTGKKATSNILVPVTGAAENVVNNFAGKITQGIIDTVTGQPTVGAQEGYRKKTLFQITTNGSNIGNVNTKETIVNANIGNAKKIPTNGTVSHGPHISDMKQYAVDTKVSKQFTDILT
tara:strand:- start:2745 stop:4007 length:1263 start_codon:yes stop_codon:yes gene_type:complete